jgi:uncharacterized protein
MIVRGALIAYSICMNWLIKAQSVLRNAFLLPVFAYRKIISPWLKPSCIYDPTCSQYMINAVRKHGIFRGFSAGLLRIGRCHGSFFEGGYDPVPTSFSFRKLISKYREFRPEKKS